MRVLIVSDWGSPAGGVEACAQRTRDALRSAGAEAWLLGCGQSREAPGADLFVRSPSSSGLRAFTQLAHPGSIAALTRARRTLRPDVIHLFPFEHEVSPGGLGALRGLPLVATIHTLKPICPTAHRLLPDGSICEHTAGRACLEAGCIGPLQRLRDRPRYGMIDAVLSRARVLSPSAALGERLRVHGIDSTVLPHAIPAPRDRRGPAPAAGPLLVSLGRLRTEKGIDLLIRAFARLRSAHPDARLRIVGDGPEREPLQRLAAELGAAGTIEFLGEVPDAPDRVLHGAWALVAPSRCEETFGLVAAEAIMRGVPVIASRRGGLSETVTAGVSGELVDNGSLESLSDTLAAFVARGPRPVPDAEVQRVRRRHAASAHARGLLEIYRAAAGRAESGLAVA